MGLITDKIIRFAIVLCFFWIVSMFIFYIIQAIPISAVVLLPIIVAVMLLETTLSFNSPSVISTCSSFFFSGQICALNIWGHIFWTLALFGIGCLIIYLKYRNKISEIESSQDYIPEKIISPKYKKLIIIGIILILITVILGFVAEFNVNQTRNDYRISSDASNFNNPQLCQQVKDNKEKERCYYKANWFINDPKVCENIVENKYYREMCESSVKNKGYYFYEDTCEHYLNVSEALKTPIYSIPESVLNMKNSTEIFIIECRYYLNKYYELENISQS